MSHPGRQTIPIQTDKMRRSPVGGVCLPLDRVESVIRLRDNGEFFQTGRTQSMSQHNLREQLEQLAQEIESLSIDDSRKQELQALLERVEQQLDQGEDAEPQDLMDQVEGAISQFETEHPTLTGILNRILVTLSSMGV